MLQFITHHRAKWLFGLPIVIAGIGLLWLAYAGQVDPNVPRVSVETVSVRGMAGERIEAEVMIRVADGYHIQANPPSDDYLIPATLTLARSDSLFVSRPVYPAGKPYYLEGSPDALSVYDGETVVTMEITPVPDLAPGDYRLSADLRYQVCDHKTCFPPKSISFEVLVSVPASEGG